MRQDLLAQVRRVIPRTIPVVVVADRAVGCPVWIDQVTALSWDAYVYAHTNALRYTDPTGHSVDENGHWTPCNLLFEPRCTFDDFGDWWGSDDGDRFRRFGKRLLTRLVQTPKDIADGLWLMVTDPVTGLKYAIRAPYDAVKNMVQGALCGNPEQMADGVFDTAGILVGGAKAYHIIDRLPTPHADVDGLRPDRGPGLPGLGSFTPDTTPTDERYPEGAGAQGWVGAVEQP